MTTASASRCPGAGRRPVGLTVGGFRRFVKASETALAELLARDLSQPEVAAVTVGGLRIAEHLMVVALAVTTRLVSGR